MIDKRVDPSAYRNQASCMASCDGNIDVVKLLVSDKRVDPSADNNFPVRMAAL